MAHSMTRLVALGVGLVLGAAGASAASALPGPLALSTEEVSRLAGLRVHGYASVEIAFTLGEQQVTCEGNQPEALFFLGRIRSSEDTTDLLSVEPNTGELICSEGPEIQAGLIQRNALWLLTVNDLGKAEVTGGSGNPVRMELYVYRGAQTLNCIYEAPRLRGTNSATTEQQKLTITFSAHRPTSALLLVKTARSRGARRRSGSVSHLNASSWAEWKAGNGFSSGSDSACDTL